YFKDSLNVDGRSSQAAIAASMSFVANANLTSSRIFFGANRPLLDKIARMMVITIAKKPSTYNGYIQTPPERICSTQSTFKASSGSSPFSSAIIPSSYAPAIVDSLPSANAVSFVVDPPLAGASISSQVSSASFTAIGCATYAGDNPGELSKTLSVCPKNTSSKPASLRSGQINDRPVSVKSPKSFHKSRVTVIQFPGAVSSICNPESRESIFPAAYV